MCKIQNIQRQQVFLKCSLAGYFLSILLVTCGCASEQPVISNDGFSISRIKIKTNGAASTSRPDMADVCKGFLLSRQQVLNFFINANHVKDNSTGNNDVILPCYVSGSAIINNEPYKWTIRSGGIGEFSSKTKKIIKVCGKDCCKKIPGVC